MKRIVLVIAIIFGTSAAIFGQAFKYRLWLTDKAGSSFSTEHPEEFLSPESISRRNRQNIPIEDSDLPVCKQYIEAITSLGVAPVVTSRWLNTVVISLNDTSVLSAIRALPFVQKAECVWKNDSTPSMISKRKRAAMQHLDADENGEYGKSYAQIALNGIDSLHRQGYRGENMTIAVLDGGFYSANNNPTIDLTHITGTRDFPHGTFSYNSDIHGAMVLSCMLSNDPQNYIGSAPQARYWLIVTEDDNSEYPVEEDYWVAGAELADSVGANIINTSLGYNSFDDASMNYSWADLDGETAFCSRGATIAASKGMLVVAAAGNEGNNRWEKVTVPGDASGILTVGAVDPNGARASFSSIGFTADGRTKPDVMATGSPARMISNGHEVISAQGTSFATPILCGGIACLWQARPEWSVAELIEAVQQSGSRADAPDEYMGYGIPNLNQALNYHSNAPVPAKRKPLAVAYTDNGKLSLLQPATRQTNVSIYNSLGQKIYSSIVKQGCSHIGYPPAAGILFILLDNGEQHHIQKIHIAQ